MISNIEVGMTTVEQTVYSLTPDERNKHANAGRSSSSSSEAVGEKLLEQFSQKTFVTDEVATDGTVISWEETNPYIEKHTVTTVEDLGEEMVTLPVSKYRRKAENTPPFQSRYMHIDADTSGKQKFYQNNPEIHACGNCANGNVACSTCGGGGTTTCNRCNGSGATNGEVCSRCSGTGRYECSTCSGTGTETCDVCDGDGKLAEGLKAAFKYTEETSVVRDKDKGIIPDTKVKPSKAVKVTEKTGAETGGEHLKEEGWADPEWTIEQYLLPATRVTYEYGDKQWEFYELDGSLEAIDYPKSRVRKALTVVAVLAVLALGVYVADVVGVLPLMV